MAIRLLVIALLFSGFVKATVADTKPPEFVLDSGDLISIKVYNENDLNVRTKIEKTGIVKMPLIGNVVVRGKTTQELALELEAMFKDGYLVAPNVAVYVEEYRPFYIRGAVRRPGAFEFFFDLTIDQAVAMAGGLRDRASEKEWFVIRGPQKKRIRVNKASVVHPGDIIEIEESLF